LSAGLQHVTLEPGPISTDRSSLQKAPVTTAWAVDKIHGKVLFPVLYKQDVAQLAVVKNEVPIVKETKGTANFREYPAPDSLTRP